MEHVYIAAVGMLVLLAICGALSPLFQDNLTQRIALSLVALGGTGEFACYLQPACHSPNARALLAVGLALYGLGTFMKILHYRSRR